MNKVNIEQNEILKIVAYLPSMLGVRIIAQLTSDPTKFALLISPTWEFTGFENKDFVGIAIVKHGYKLFPKEISFKFQDREKILSEIKF